MTRPDPHPARRRARRAPSWLAISLVVALLAALSLSGCTISIEGPGTSGSFPEMLGETSGPIEPTPPAVPVPTCHPERHRAVDRSVVVRGCIATPDGRPARARISAHYSIHNPVPDAVIIATSFPFGPWICLAQEVRCGSIDDVTTRTDAAGRFTLVLPRRPDGAPGHWSGLTLDLPHGVTASLDLPRHQHRVVTVPPIQAWRPTIEIDPRSTLHVGMVPGVYEPGRYELTVGRPGGPHYPLALGLDVGDGSDAAAVTATVPGHLLMAGRSRVHLELEHRGIRYRAPTRTVVVPGPVISRGADCVAIMRGNQALPAHRHGVCGLTDDDLRHNALSLSALCVDPLSLNCIHKARGARVDLGGTWAISDVVVAGAGEYAEVRLSTDGETWTTYPLDLGGWRISATGRLEDVQARYVWVRTDRWDLLKEIQVFG